MRGDISRLLRNNWCWSFDFFRLLTFSMHLEVGCVVLKKTNKQISYYKTNNTLNIFCKNRIKTHLLNSVKIWATSSIVLL